jgi:hypothetical protein
MKLIRSKAEGRNALSTMAALLRRVNAKAMALGQAHKDRPGRIDAFSKKFFCAHRRAQRP